MYIQKSIALTWYEVKFDVYFFFYFVLDASHMKRLALLNELICRYPVLIRSLKQKVKINCS